jgi:hypothetical protein
MVLLRSTSLRIKRKPTVEAKHSYWALQIQL